MLTHLKSLRGRRKPLRDLWGCQHWPGFWWGSEEDAALVVTPELKSGMHSSEPPERVCLAGAWEKKGVWSQQGDWQETGRLQKSGNLQKGKGQGESSSQCFTWSLQAPHQDPFLCSQHPSVLWHLSLHTYTPASRPLFWSTSCLVCASRILDMSLLVRTCLAQRCLIVVIYCLCQLNILLPNQWTLHLLFFKVIICISHNLPSPVKTFLFTASRCTIQFYST